jgi:serine/threonine-protein kinase
LTVPSVVNQEEAAAVAALRAAGFTQPQVQRQEETDPARQGVVLAQDPPPGTQAPKDQRITLTVGAAPDEVQLPDVAGRSPEEATAALVAAGVSRNAITRVDLPSATVAAGLVIGTEPTGRVPAGEEVQLQVSTGPEKVAVPDVVNLAQGSAEQLIINARLVPRTTTRELRPGDAGIGVVIDQDPDDGAEVDVGSTVSLVVGVAGTTTTSASTTTSRGGTTTTNED